MKTSTLGSYRFTLFVSALLLTLGISSGVSEGANVDMYSISPVSSEGKKIDLHDYRGKTLLIVNTASQCGFTPQYEGLEQTFQKYRKQGFVVLGFPSNDFGGQEPGTDAEIRYFCKSKYHVEFPLFKKDHVTGAKTQPLFAWLIANSATHEAIDWNFEKFLVSGDGKVIGRFKSGITPDQAELDAAIRKALP